MTSTAKAVEARNNHPATMLQQQYSARLAALVPSHVNGEAWVRQATGALRSPDLADAAQSDFGSFVTAVERAAVLGLRPGSEEFYLIPRKIKGRLQVQGIIGYQGLVDLMYRSGAVSTVVAEVVHQADRFDYQPGRYDRPSHFVDWDADDRGPLRLAYAFAVMKDGATSKVVVLNRADIERIKKSSDGASSSFSPWVNHEASMWLKSAVRQLAKWVPTSAEHMAQTRQAEHVAAAVVRDARPPVQVLDSAGQQTALTAGGLVDTLTGELLDDPEADGEFDPTAAESWGQEGAGQ